MDQHSNRAQPGNRQSPDRLRRVRCGWLIIGLALVTAGWTMAAEVPTKLAAGSEPSITREKAIASFLLNCVYYGSWPDAVATNGIRSVRIGILGRDAAIEKALNEVAADFMHKNPNQRIKVGRSLDLGELKGGQLIFVSGGANELAEAASSCKDRPLLLVSEGRNALEQGATIQIEVRNNRPIRFQLNLDRLNESGVQLGPGFKKKASVIVEAGKRQVIPEGE